MTWPWKRRQAPVEQRNASGDYSDQVLRLAEAQASGTAANVASTAAMETAAGALSRMFAAVEVEAPPWAKRAITPATMALIGRSLVRHGQSLHVIDVSGGDLVLLPAASWHWQNRFDDARPGAWRVRATWYGPSTSTTKVLPHAGVVFLAWGSSPGTPYAGTGPASWAYYTARMQSELERSIGDEASGPIAQLLPQPDEGAMGDDDGGDAGDDGPSITETIRNDITRARGRAAMVPTTRGAFGQGPSAQPAHDWRAERLGPNPPEAMEQARRGSFDAMLAACGFPVPLASDADGTAQRAAMALYFTLTVRPLLRLVEFELSAKLETPVRLSVDRLSGSTEIHTRASSFQKLVAGGMAVNEAVAVSGLLLTDE